MVQHPRLAEPTFPARSTQTPDPSADTLECKDTWRKTLCNALLSGGDWCVTGPGWNKEMKQVLVDEIFDVSRAPERDCHCRPCPQFPACGPALLHLGAADDPDRQAQLGPHRAALPRQDDQPGQGRVAQGRRAQDQEGPADWVVNLRAEASFPSRPLSGRYAYSDIARLICSRRANAYDRACAALCRASVIVVSSPGRHRRRSRMSC